MTNQQTLHGEENPGLNCRYLELAVPAFSFGGAILALIFSGMGSSVDIRYFAFGSVISSFVLAYLAWIRPRKDIVAMTTPIYSIIFFVAPSEIAVNLILELLYATSLTILLIRLKYRFGEASSNVKGTVLEEPVKGYCTSVSGIFSGVDPMVGHLAAMGFIHFAKGNYREVILVADEVLEDLARVDSVPALVTAFKIIREQARLLDESADQPEEFIEFSRTDADILVKMYSPEDTIRDRFEITLENALLFLFAAGWVISEMDHRLLLTGQDFAIKLYAP